MDKEIKDTVKPSKKIDQQNRKKWTASIYDAGWICIPIVLLERQADLGVNSQELNVLLQIIKHWWTKDSLPIPSRQSIADSIGCMTSQTVQRHLTSLKEKGLIAIERRKRPDGGYTSSKYHFKDLIVKLTPLAKEVLQERQEKNDINRYRRSKSKKSKDGGS